MYFLNILQKILEVDLELFKLINIEGSVSFLNGFMLLMREAYTWIPLYAFILFWTIKYNRAHTVAFIALTLLCFGITDFTSASILKPYFARLRPCHNPDLVGVINSLVGCGGENSFPSSHASNHFGLAAFWFNVVLLESRKKWYWLWLWAILVGYAQIYVGKHYPLDILGGAALGLIAGYLCFFIYLKVINRKNKDIVHSATT